MSNENPYRGNQPLQCGCIDMEEDDNLCLLPTMSQSLILAHPFSWIKKMLNILIFGVGRLIGKRTSCGSLLLS